MEAELESRMNRDVEFHTALQHKYMCRWQFVHHVAKRIQKDNPLVLSDDVIVMLVDVVYMSKLPMFHENVSNVVAAMTDPIVIRAYQQIRTAFVMFVDDWPAHRLIATDIDWDDWIESL
jgi:hypothetical protein